MHESTFECHNFISGDTVGNESRYEINLKNDVFMKRVTINEICTTGKLSADRVHRHQPC